MLMAFFDVLIMAASKKLLFMIIVILDTLAALLSFFLHVPCCISCLVLFACFMFVLPVMNSYWEQKTEASLNQIRFIVFKIIDWKHVSKRVSLFIFLTSEDRNCRSAIILFLGGCLILSQLFSPTFPCNVFLSQNINSSILETNISLALILNGEPCLFLQV